MSELSTVRGLLALYAESSVHAGTGAQLGAVDLPIQRERHTGWPTIYGSGIKGVLRDLAERSWSAGDPRVKQVFGPPTEKDERGEVERHSGAFAVSDARLLLFPVRTLERAFCWVTCPLALARLARDARSAGLSPPAVTSKPQVDKVVVASKPRSGRVLLEEFDFEAVHDASASEAGKWIAANLLPTGEGHGFWREQLAEALVIVADDAFSEFVTCATEIVTRVKLGENKRVETRALWNEENLPADSLLYSVAVAWNPVPGPLAGGRSVMDAARQLIDSERVLQIGGKETIGRGFMAARLAGGLNGQAG